MENEEEKTENEKVFLVFEKNRRYVTENQSFLIFNDR